MVIDVDLSSGVRRCQQCGAELPADARGQQLRRHDWAPSEPIRSAAACAPQGQRVIAGGPRAGAESLARPAETPPAPGACPLYAKAPKPPEVTKTLVL